MAVIDVSTDEQVLDALDFDHRLPCRVTACDASATVVVKCRGCSASSLYCDEHLVRFKASVRELGLVCLICAHCGHKGFTFDEFCTVIPIGGQS